MKRSEVQVLLGPPGSLELSEDSENGDLAQLVEHLLCKQGVRGSTPLVSTKTLSRNRESFFFCEALD